MALGSYQGCGCWWSHDYKEKGIGCNEEKEIGKDHHWIYKENESVTSL